MFKVASSTEKLIPDRGDIVRVPPGAGAIHRKCGVYTRPEIVDEILDAVGWTADADLSKGRLLEPAAGDGVFVAAAATRLLSSMRRLRRPLTVKTLVDRIRAFEIHPREGQKARMRLAHVLSQASLSARDCKVLAARWITIGDFLLTNLPERSISHVVGNPPYTRWSKIPKSLRRKYDRSLPRRMTKGDLFLPFLDLSIGYLVPGGRLGFVCSDRWRFMAFAEGFRQERLPEIVVERDRALSAASAYIRDVDVYPSILVIRRKSRLRLTRPAGDSGTKRSLADVGYMIRVGPALGWTPAYVLDPDEDDVEPELVAPWIDGADIQEGEIRWHGRRVIALHDDSGRLRLLRDYPRAASRLRRHRQQLKERAIVRAGAVWYRPIDRVIRVDWARPKLVIPEMARIPRVAIDRSGAIPSHGVYAIFAADDDVEKLYESLRDGGLAEALDGIAPKVKGGYVRCYRRFLEKIAIA